MRIPAEALRYVPATRDHLKPGNLFRQGGEWWLITEHPDGKESDPFGVCLQDGVMSYLNTDAGLTLSRDYNWRVALDTLDPVQAAPQCGTVSLGLDGHFIFGGYHEKKAAFSLPDGNRLTNVRGRAAVYPRWSAEVFRRDHPEFTVAVLFTIDRGASKGLAA